MRPVVLDYVPIRLTVLGKLRNGTRWVLLMRFLRYLAPCCVLIRSNRELPLSVPVSLRKLVCRMAFRLLDPCV